MAMRFNPPPGWPVPPEGFTPDSGWQPDPSWPPAPAGWQLWLHEPDAGAPNWARPQVAPRLEPAPALTVTSAPAAAAAPAPGWPAAAPSPGDAAPAGYAAAPGGPAQPGYGEPAAAWAVQAASPAGRSGLAIASFVLGLLGIIGISAILGIVLGIVALRQLRGTLQTGRQLAIAGVVLGSLWIAGGIAVIVVVALTGVTPVTAPAAGSAPAGGVSAFSLTRGDCFNNPAATAQPGGKVQHVDTVVRKSCTQLHNAQIFATFKVSGGTLSYPGETKLHDLAATGCESRLKANLDLTRVTPSMVLQFLYPLEGSWFEGQRTISCIVQSPTTTLATSLLKS